MFEKAGRTVGKWIDDALSWMNQVRKCSGIFMFRWEKNYTCEHITEEDQGSSLGFTHYQDFDNCHYCQWGFVLVMLIGLGPLGYVLFSK